MLLADSRVHYTDQLLSSIEQAFPSVQEFEIQTYQPVQDHPVSINTRGPLIADNACNTDPDSTGIDSANVALLGPRKGIQDDKLEFSDREVEQVFAPPQDL